MGRFAGVETRSVMRISLSHDSRVIDDALVLPYAPAMRCPLLTYSMLLRALVTAFAFAMCCLVLTWRMLLRAALRCPHGMSGTATGYGASLYVKNVWYSNKLCCYAVATGCAVLRQGMVQPPPKKIQEIALLVQIALKLRFLVLDFGVQAEKLCGALKDIVENPGLIFAE
eukprot:3681624-Rhodomonas_salina.1